MTQVPFGDMKAHYQQFKSDIDTAVNRVLASGHYILGPELDKFEKDFAKFVGVNYAVGCSCGTEAIYLALAAMGVGPGDEVITVAHTAVPTINAISMTGATPVFVDIDPVTYVMDVNSAESKITEKTKAIVPVHLYGQMVNMEPLMKLSLKHRIPVMEDIAQATGSLFKGAMAGTIGEYGAFSFYPSKNLGAFGDGGMVVTNSKENYELLLKLRNMGQSQRYHHDIVGINSRLDEIQAAILGAQLPYVNQWNTRRREIAKRYNEGLKGLVKTPQEASYGAHVYHLYVIQTENRDEMQKYLSDKGIQCLIHYPIPGHLQKAYAFLGYKKGDLPVTEHAANHILSLPMYPELTNEQVDQVIAAVRDYCKEKNTAPVATPMSAQVAGR
ncbi:MAG: DegT/DnrJ/EryC1/StrS family aminotransferase [Candidatus Obscuribacterales bacterium]|nr:DegT/DnrJ/EryC1/StrS family aminotransferase [Candidatus Obscuribacterales bacterium]